MGRSLARLVGAALAVGLCVLAMMQPAMAQEAPGFEPERIKRDSALEDGNGVVILSVRSELYLVAKLNVYFLREGGDVDNSEDVVRFTRSQPALSFGNSTTKYKVLSVQMPAGRYRLVGHGAKCLKVPAPDERCLADVKFAGIGETVSFPSRGYGEGAPVFEVRDGAVTVAGDFGLTARNTLEWSAIPGDKLSKASKPFRGLASGPEPEVAESFQLKFPLRPRSMEDDRGRRY